MSASYDVMLCIVKYSTVVAVIAVRFEEAGPWAKVSAALIHSISFPVACAPDARPFLRNWNTDIACPQSQLLINVKTKMPADAVAITGGSILVCSSAAR
jgi:hypothetical protein